MPSLDSLKENLYSFIAKNEHVDHHKLLRWAEEHGTGKLGLFLLLKMLEREKRIVTSELKESLASIKLKDGEFRIEIPRSVEPAHTQVHRTVTKKKVATLETILGLESAKKSSVKKTAKTTARTATAEKITTQRLTQETSTAEEKHEIKIEAEPRLHATQSEIVSSVTSGQETSKNVSQVSTITTMQQIETSRSEAALSALSHQERVPGLREIVHEVIEESRGLSVDASKLEQVITSILVYLSRYWSVGELRLRLDISKMLSQKLGINQEVLFELVGRILKVLRRFDIVEIVEPGVVNLLKKDVCKEFRIKLSEVLGF